MRTRTWKFYDRTALQFQNQPSETLQIARTHALYRADPALELSATVGYEDNELQFTTERGVTYGVGGRWHPTDRTNVDAKWEHRFFGASYNVLFDHRTPLSVWSLRASRDITNYPSQLAALPGGANVAGFLNSLLLSKVPDPTQRQIFAIMPWVLIFVMAPFAAGLQLYWLTNNVLSIAQQWWLYRRFGLSFHDTHPVEE